MNALTLEVVEGPDAGRTVRLDAPVEIGRDPGVGFALADPQASRHHARVTAGASGAFVEDLGSSNGTFVNAHELHGRATLAPGDELLIGVNVLILREDAAPQASAVRAVPAALAKPAQRPTYTDRRTPNGGAPGTAVLGPDDRGTYGKLDGYVDSRVKLQAKLAPLAVTLLAVLVVVVWLGTT